MTMNYPNDNSLRASLQGLRRFTLARAAEPAPHAHCELCAAELAPEHRHLLELSSRACLCACDACALLFSNERQRTRYRAIPRRSLVLTQFRLDDAQWDALMLPVNMVYIFRTGKGARAFYPSPAGAMESLLDLENWESIVLANAILREMEEDVEALLINRVGENREYYLVPIDVCYQLVGLIRLHWRGLSGGQEAWEAIGNFFHDLRERSTPLDEGGQPCRT